MEYTRSVVCRGPDGAGWVRLQPSPEGGRAPEVRVSSW